MPYNNSISQVRPKSTFDDFEPSTPERQKLLSVMQGLAAQMVDKRSKIAKEKYPFDAAKLIILWGKPGRGKTHLIEALINRLRVEAPELLQKIFLSREDFTLMNIAGLHSYDNLPIIILDDLFVRHQDVSQLHPATDIEIFMKFIMKIYDERRLVIVTTNFPFKDGILRRVREVDKIGRVASRLDEILSKSGEIEVQGEDFRKKLVGSAEEVFVL